MKQEIVEKCIKDALAALKDTGKKVALVYPNGFVPNSYKWPAPSQRVRVFQDGRFRVEWYDRKRSYGAGSYITLWNK